MIGHHHRQSGTPPLLRILTDEGLRLFFPLAAVHAALWPVLWVMVLGLDLPLARTVPPTFWHPHEMLIGAFGAALMGFVTTAVPEWTGTPGPRPRTLLILAGLWLLGRFIGLLGFDALGWLGALADVGWLSGLAAYVVRVGIQKRTTKILGFQSWLLLLLAAELVTRAGFLTADLERAGLGLRLVGLAYLGLLGIALARIYVPVINLVLDPSEHTSPYRPHPGRQNLASGLVALVALAELLSLSAEIRGYLCIAAGAAFLDRAGEAFIGKGFLRTEVLALFSSAVLAGGGLLLLGAARLGAPFPESTGLHVALMGGVGMGVMSVFSIAGLIHTGHRFKFPNGARAGALLLAAAAMARVLPDLLPGLSLPISHYTASATLWAIAFAAWLAAYWPMIRDPGTIGRHEC